jgi:hypothetical protein
MTPLNTPVLAFERVFLARQVRVARMPVIQNQHI